MFRKASQVQAVQNASFGDPTLARRFHAPMGQIDFQSGMGVGIDAHHAAEVEGALVPTPVKVKTPGIGIDLDGDAVLRASSKTLFDVDVVPRTAEQMAARHVSEDGRVGVGDGSNDALGLALAVEAEQAVHARNDKIEALKNVIGVVQRTIAQDVRFNALKHTKAASVVAVQTFH
jgi:hypothetical protein